MRNKYEFKVILHYFLCHHYYFLLLYQHVILLAKPFMIFHFLTNISKLTHILTTNIINNKKAINEAINKAINKAFSEEKKLLLNFIKLFFKSSSNSDIKAFKATAFNLY